MTKEKLLVEMERDPVFSAKDMYDNSKDETRERTMEKIAQLGNFVATEDRNAFSDRFHVSLSSLC